jgi:alpha-D-ribose 1-methylphosphonate 5-triphosphate diphosphatase
LIRHKFHLRIELDNIAAFDIVKLMLEKNLVHAISFMDHTPGQGQYKNLEVYRKAISAYAKDGMDDKKFEDILTEHNTKPKLSFEQMKILSEMANERGLPVASHDDDTIEKLAVNRELGVTVSEFPITMSAAKAAKEHGFFTVVGAANILRNGSHSGNLSATEAVLEDCADIICSDYYPAAILHSVFLMHTKYGVPLPQMVNRATLTPAKAMKTDAEYGSVEPGKKADLLIVDILDGYPVITHGFVDGHSTYRVKYRR